MVKIIEVKIFNKSGNVLIFQIYIYIYIFFFLLRIKVQCDTTFCLGEEMAEPVSVKK